MHFCQDEVLALLQGSGVVWATVEALPAIGVSFKFARQKWRRWVWRWRRK